MAKLLSCLPAVKNWQNYVESVFSVRQAFTSHFTLFWLNFFCINLINGALILANYCRCVQGLYVRERKKIYRQQRYRWWELRPSGRLLQEEQNRGPSSDSKQKWKNSTIHILSSRPYWWSYGWKEGVKLVKWTKQDVIAETYEGCVVEVFGCILLLVVYYIINWCNLFSGHHHEEAY